MRWIIGSLIATGIFASTGADAGSASGSYVGDGHNAAFMVQLVEGDSGKLTGRYVQVRLTPSGTVEESNSAVTGAVDGQTVVVTIKPTELLSGSITASGKLDASTLDLSGGGYGATLKLHLRKSNEAEFHRLIATLKLQSQQLAETKRKAEFLGGVNNAISRVNDLADKIRAGQLKLDAAAIGQRYRRATELMRSTQARQNGIIGSDQASVARAQLGVNIHQISIQAESLHSDIQANQKSFHAAVETLGKTHAVYIRDCQQIVTDAVLAPSPETKSACTMLGKAVSALSSRIKALEATYQSAEMAWNEERQKQQKIVKDSEYASR